MEKKGEMGSMTRANMESTSEHGPSLRSESSSSSSSSIGQPDDDDEEVESTLSSLASLEDSLPIKRQGLSKFYGGKSKSYGNLGDVQDLAKSDNPFNKRRRTLLAYKLMFRDNPITSISSTSNHNNNKNDIMSKSKGGLFYAHSNHISMPLLPLSEDDDEDDDDDGVRVELQNSNSNTHHTASNTHTSLYI